MAAPDALIAQLSTQLGLAAAQAEPFLAHARRIALARGEHWVEVGSQPTCLALVLSGMMRHYYPTPSGEATRWIALPGTFTAPLLSLLRSEPSLEAIAAVEATELLEFPYARVRELRQRSPEFQARWAEIIEGHYLGMESRVHALIALSAAERYAQMQQQFPDILRQAPLQYVASMLGITPQHLSRLRARR